MHLSRLSHITVEHQEGEGERVRTLYNLQWLRARAGAGPTKARAPKDICAVTYSSAYLHDVPEPSLGTNMITIRSREDILLNSTWALIQRRCFDYPTILTLTLGQWRRLQLKSTIDSAAPYSAKGSP